MATPKSTRISLFNHVVDSIQDIIPHEYFVKRESETKAFFESHTYHQGEQVNRVGVYVDVIGNFMNFEVTVRPLFDPLDEGLLGGLPRNAYALSLNKHDILDASFNNVITEWTKHHIHDNMGKTVHQAFTDMHPEEQQDLADELLGTVNEQLPQEEIMSDKQETIALDREEVQQEIKAQKGESAVARNTLTLDIVYKVLKLHASGVNEETIAEVLSNDTYIIDSETVSTLITKVKNAGFQAV